MSWLANRKVAAMTDPVDGTLTLNATSAPPVLGQRAQSFSFTGVVRAPGLEPTAVEVHGMAAPAAKWPQPGSSLPVVVDRADPQRLVIQWDQVATGRDLAYAQAQADAWRQRTGLDTAVLAQALTQAGDPPPADAVTATPTDPGHPEHLGPAQRQPSTGIEVTGTVIAVREVQLPAGLAPPGGVSDLTVQLDPNRTAVARVRFESMQQHDLTAVPGATVQVLIDPANPTLVTLAPPDPPT